MVRGILHSKKLFIGGDFNGYIKSTIRSFDGIHDGFRLRVRDRGGVSLLNFAKASKLVIVNSCFLKEDHLVTFCSMVGRTQIYYLL